MPALEGVRPLVSMVEAGRFVEASEELYAPLADLDD
jgi:hypothetical protein